MFILKCKCLYLMVFLKAIEARLVCESYFAKIIGVTDDSDCSYEQLMFMAKMAEGVILEAIKL